MKLAAVVLDQFRGYSSPTYIALQDFTAFVGRNDVGKSTILEALDLFFEGGIIAIDRSDLCKDAPHGFVRISCIFDVSDNKVVLDTSAQTTLASEYLLTKDGKLHITKAWDCSLQKPTAKVFVRCWHPTAKGYDNLLGADNKSLKAMVKAQGLEAKCNLTSNPSMRRALWDNCPDLKTGEVEVRIDEPGAKPIWEQVKAWLPEFALFQADRASTVDDDEVQTPMKLAVKRALADAGPQVSEIVNKVVDQAMAIAQRTIGTLALRFPDVANDFKPRLKKQPDLTKLFELALDDSNGIPVDKRGSGVRRLILLSFFLAEVERRRSEPPENSPARGMIYAVEEPETGQHPANQLLIIEALQTLAASGDQVMITTHNPALAGRLATNCLRFVQRTKAGAPTVRAGDDETLALIARELGILPAPVARKASTLRVALVVEGASDEDALTAFSRTLRIAGDLNFCLETRRDEIFVVIGGGSNLQHWVDRQHLDKLGLPQIHLYDSDKQQPTDSVKKETAARVQSLQHRADVQVFVTRRRCMDNYLHVPTVAAHLQAPLNLGSNDPAFMDMAKYFVRAIMPAIKAKSAKDGEQLACTSANGNDVPLRDSKAKEWIARYFMPLMTTDDIRAVSAYKDPEGDRHEVLEWLNAVGSHLQPLAATPSHTLTLNVQPVPRAVADSPSD